MGVTGPPCEPSQEPLAHAGLTSTIPSHSPSLGSHGKMAWNKAAQGTDGLPGVQGEHSAWSEPCYDYRETSGSPAVWRGVTLRTL